MQVKIGNKLYDAEASPICLILTDEEKQRIGAMAPGVNKYAACPEGMLSAEQMRAWMDADEATG